MIFLILNNFNILFSNLSKDLIVFMFLLNKNTLLLISYCTFFYVYLFKRSLLF